MNEAVADAGPLIHLAEISSLALLHVFDVVHIPGAVWFESIQPGRVSEAELQQIDHLRLHTLTASEVSAFVAKHNLRQLHAGEQEALWLGHTLGVSLLLTDDLSVRDAARQLGLNPVGSLGVIVRAHKQGQIALAEAEQRITELYMTSSLFVTWAIVELAIQQLHRRHE